MLGSYNVPFPTPDVCCADNRPPVLTAATFLSSTTNYSLPVATDNLDPTPTVTCNPPPGSVQPGYNSKLTLNLHISTAALMQLSAPKT
jgi:hypothetical protein